MITITLFDEESHPPTTLLYLKVATFKAALMKIEIFIKFAAALRKFILGTTLREIRIIFCIFATILSPFD